ncbi:unnamed protein product [Nezara viridula]|uniref:Methyltransferase type 11 domain-containing protein n=1 Tax=Nezara viridula TaxID=85310 RepID=A0A9P0H6X3_NEZVI|nr:unnamed protein product [Nezara viridula]
MNNPELYTNVNALQKRDAQEVLEEVKDLLPWSIGENVLDVGCGPGDLTTSLLTSYLANDYRVVGCDISEAMVKYAQAKYGNDQFCFKQLDISNGNIWMNWEEEIFDKVFSFYCLHWVKDQMQAAENIYSLLKDGGYFVTMFTISHPFLILFSRLKENPKWQPYTKIWKTWDAFHNSRRDPKEEYIQILKETGFQVIKCITRETSFVHPSTKAFIEYFESINPFKKRLPKDKGEEFLQDCQNFLIEMGLLEINEKQEAVHKYTVMTTVAKKGSNFDY